MKSFNLTYEELKALRIEHKIAKKHSAKSAYRINAVILLGSGWTLEEVSNALLLDQETLRTYIKKFIKGGVKTLLENICHGRKSRLDASQKIELSQYLETHLLHTTQEAIAHVKRQFRIVYSQSGMTKLLHSLGFSYKKPKLIPSGFDVQAQDEFIEYFERFMKKKLENDTVIFYDSSHPQYQSYADYGWIKKGVDMLLLNHGMRGRVNISGGVDLETGEVIVDFPDKVNSETTVEMFKKIEHCYSNAKTIHIILDNASSHKSRLVKNYIKNSKINLVFLPPYSPNLNLMERIWGLFRRKLLINSWNRTFFEFKKRIKYFFRKTLIDKSEKWVMPLMTETFQEFRGNFITE